jgi:hypothetical protein
MGSWLGQLVDTSNGSSSYDESNAFILLPSSAQASRDDFFLWCQFPVLLSERGWPCPVIYYDQIADGANMIILQQRRVYRKVMGFQADRCCEALSVDVGERRSGLRTPARR